MLTENQKKWIAALRSGEYKQGKYLLKTEDGCYCCLGVCELLAISDGHGSEYKLQQRGSVLSDSAKHWVGLQTAGGSPSDRLIPTLTGLNDCDGFTFEMIADHLEKHADLYFVTPQDE